MRLLSASEDLAVRTLENVAGTLGKLLYLSGLRDSSGRYSHWGLAQVYGEVESQTAIRDAHKSALREILRKPVRELWKEMGEISLADQEGPIPELKRELWQQLLPQGSSRISKSHFNSVLRALAELDHSRKQASNRPAA
jgi:hypothetical protein